MLPLVIISDIAYLFCGVRRGSILGPLLFLIYVNDIKYCDCDSRLFADDTDVFVSDTSVCDVNGQANSILSSLSAWFTSNKLSVSIDKTCYSLFNCDRKDGCSRILSLATALTCLTLGIGMVLLMKSAGIALCEMIAVQLLSRK